MGYLGRDIQYGSFAKQTLTADSSTTVFTLSNGVADANNLLVSIGGIIQEPNVAYTAIGTVVTFASAPVTNDPIFITFLGMETTTAASARDDVTYQIGTGNGTTTPITLSMSVVNSDAIRVSLNGVVQTPWTDFTASGTTLTFSTAPDATNEILVYYIGKEDSISVVTTGSVTAAKLAASGTMPAWNGSNITGITVLPYSKFNDLKTNLSLMGFRRSQHHGTSNLDLPNGFIDQFQDKTNVDDDASVNATYYPDNFSTAYITSDRTSTVTVTTNVNVNVGVITALVNGSTTTGVPNSVAWHNQTAAGLWIQFQFPVKTAIDEATWIQDNIAVGGHGDWKWQGSDNGSHWHDVGESFTLGIAPLSGGQSVQIHSSLNGNTNGYMYWRMYGVSGSLMNTTYLKEIQFKQTTTHLDKYYSPTVPTYLPVSIFDGTNDYLNRSSVLTGSANGKVGTASFWINLKGGDSSFTRLMSSTSQGGLDIIKTSDNTWRFTGSQNDASTKFEMFSTNAFTVSTGWHHVLASWDLANSTGKMYITPYGGTEVDETTSTTFVNADIHYPKTAYGIMAQGNGGNKMNGELAQFYVNFTEYVDLSVTSNRRKFITAAGKPVDLGANGSTPTGTQPIVYLNNPYDTFHNNLGTGGNFTENGTLTQGTNLTITSNNMTLVSESETAATAPEKAYVTMFNEPVDSLTLNTDIMAWVSRSNKTITATNASNVLNATAHGLSNGDRVILASTWVDAVPSANQCSAMTSANAPSGTVSSDQTGSFGYHNWHAFEQPATQSRYYSNQGNSGNAFLQYSFNNGLTAKVIVKYSIRHVNGFGTNSAPKDFALKASNTGAFSGEEVTLDTQTNQTYTAGGTNIYSFSNSTSYVHYRLAIGNIAHAGGEVGISNMELWAATVDGYSTLPTGLNSDTAYHVVNKTANTFQVAATNGGAAVAFTTDGTGTHKVYAVTQTTLADKGDYGTGKAILAGNSDISGQPTGTDVRLIVQTKNSKETKLHGTAVQYGNKD